MKYLLILQLLVSVAYSQRVQLFTRTDDIFTSSNHFTLKNRKVIFWEDDVVYVTEEEMLNKSQSNARFKLTDQARDDADEEDDDDFEAELDEDVWNRKQLKLAEQLYDVVAEAVLGARE